MREYIVNRALLCLAESVDDGVDFVDQSVFPIEQFVDEAGLRVTKLAPARVLNSNTSAADLTDDEIDQYGVYRATLPKGFARLLSFQMNGWKRPVYTPIYDTDPQYAMQLHPATRGGIVNPIVAIVRGNHLEAFSSTTGDTLKTFEAVAYNSVDDLADCLKDATAWMAASLFLASMGELDMAKVLESKSVEILQLL